MTSLAANSNIAEQYAVISFLIELCEGKGCGNAVLNKVFAGVSEISKPGQAIQTGALDFSELVTLFGKNDVWR